MCSGSRVIEVELLVKRGYLMEGGRLHFVSSATAELPGGPGEDSTSASVYEIDPLRDPRWTEFVETNPDASVFHSPAWLTALRDSYGYTPAVLCTSQPGERIVNGVVFCRVTSWLMGNRIVSLPFSDHCDLLVSNPSDLSAILQRLRDEVQEKHWRYLELRPLKEGLGLNAGLEECRTYLWHWIDLSGAIEELFKRFDKDSAQRRIRRAERESLKYEAGNSESLLKKFLHLFVMTRCRHGLPPQPQAWFRHLSRCFGDQMQIRVISYRERPIASSVTLKHGQTVTYKYGCSDIRFKSLGGMPLLFWRTIEEAKREGFTRFDLGRSDIDNAGLIRFKENWNPQRVTLKYYKTAGNARGGTLRLANKLTHTAARVAPKWSLITVGKLLYRHVG